MGQMRLRKLWLSVRRSAWYPAIAALPPSLVISFVWNYGATGGLMGFFASFVAVEALVILILIVARPALQAERILAREGVIEVDTPEANVLVGKIRAEAPPDEFSGEWTEQFPKFRDAWIQLLQESEKALRANAVTPENLRTMTNILASTSAQIRAGRPFDIYTLKKAACYLQQPDAQNVTRVLVVNRIRPVLWFTPEMVIYFLDLFRHVKDHPLDPQFIRISMFEEEDWRRASEPRWRRLPDVDPLKAFVAINQMAGIYLKGLTRKDFSQVVERFIAANESKMQVLGGTEVNELKEFIRDVAFIMYCEDETPIKVFRGRPYPPRIPQNQHGEPVIMWPEIEDMAERMFYYDLFVTLDKEATLLLPTNLAKVSW